MCNTELVKNPAYKLGAKEAKLKYTVFYSLAYRLVKKLITPEEFIAGWKAEQDHQRGVK
jgi:hypothetical protein